MSKVAQAVILLTLVGAIGISQALANLTRPVGEVGPDWCKDTPCIEFQFVPNSSVKEED